MPRADLVQYAHDLPLPTGWHIRGVSLSRPYSTIGFRFDNGDADEMDVEFIHETGREVEVTLRKAGFDPQWLYNMLALMAQSPSSVTGQRFYARG